MVALKGDESEDNEFDSVVKRKTEEKRNDDLERERVAGIAYSSISTEEARCSDTLKTLTSSDASAGGLERSQRRCRFRRKNRRCDARNKIDRQRRHPRPCVSGSSKSSSAVRQRAKHEETESRLHQVKEEMRIVTHGMATEMTGETGR
jgi:hypothetical protein